MKIEGNPVTIVIADDDEDDCLLAREALEAVRLNNDIRFVKNGEELLHYLRGEGAYGDPMHAPRPHLILLDLNMPKMDGREALHEIKMDKRLRSIPVVVLTTSAADTDVLRSYDLGANSFITKPVTFQGLVDVMQEMSTYWFQVVELAPQDVKEAPG